METADHVARVTGDGSGQGEAAERRLASHGAQVAVLDFDDAPQNCCYPQSLLPHSSKGAISKPMCALRLRLQPQLKHLGPRNGSLQIA